jgi:hypothetical protein
VRIELVVLSLVLSCLPVSDVLAAPANPTKVYPGDVDGGDGGAPFEDRCPDGSFLVGFQIGDGDQVMETIRPYCASYDTEQQRFAARIASSEPPHGGQTRAIREASCPEGYFATGMWFGQTARRDHESNNDAMRPLDFVALQCNGVGAPDPVTVCFDTGQGCGKRVLVHSTTGFVRLDYMMNCTDGEALVGIRGRASATVDALGGVCSTTRPIRAAAERVSELCDTYAQGASSAATQNQNLGCGFRGERWAEDRAFHRSWCMLPDNNRVAALNAEITARNNKLGQCDPGAIAEVRFRIGETVADADPSGGPTFEVPAGPSVLDMVTAPLSVSAAVAAPGEPGPGDSTETLNHEGVAAIAKPSTAGADAGNDNEASSDAAVVDASSGLQKAIATSRVTIRSQGTKDSKALGTLSPGDEVSVVGCTGNWCEFQFEGGTAFVFKKYIGR